MKWIGVTGGIATGKSTFSTQAKGLGYPVIDADQVSHEVTLPGEEGYLKIVEEFGSEVLDSEKRINRKKLGALVFAHPEKLQKLEDILHPIIRHRVEQKKIMLIEQGHEMAFYDVPLLFEKNLQGQFDATLLVYASRDLQISRIKKRNSWSNDETLNRLASQLDIEEKRKMADFVVDNTSDIEGLSKSVKLVIAEIKKTLLKAQI